MTNSRETGRAGERIASDYLFSKGYRVIKRNFYTPHGELDIVAEKDNTIVFVEVKFRLLSGGYGLYGRPADAVNFEKQKHLLYSARYFINKFHSGRLPRMDVIEIVGDDVSVPGFVITQINHIENAFRE